MLPENEWLPQARRLAVGQQRKVRHNEEHTYAMTVGNDMDKWWAYCHRCKVGGMVRKDHVNLAEPVYHRKPIQYVLKPLHELDQHTELRIARFLLSKGLDLSMIPPSHVWYDHERRRMVLQSPGSPLMGRALDEGVTPKWLDYTEGAWYKPSVEPWPGTNYVLVEDALSAYKLQYVAHKFHIPIIAVCCHGTRVRDALMRQLVWCATRLAVWFDNDAAGNNGRLATEREFRGYGRPVWGIVSSGDPKDATIQEIKEKLSGFAYPNGAAQ